MSPKEPWYKGLFVDRDLIRERLEQGFRLIATGNHDDQMGRLVNFIELYTIHQVMDNLLTSLVEIKKDIDQAVATAQDTRALVGREMGKRYGMALAEEEKDERDDEGKRGG